MGIHDSSAVLELIAGNLFSVFRIWMKIILTPFPPPGNGIGAKLLEVSYRTDCFI